MKRRTTTLRALTGFVVREWLLTTAAVSLALLSVATHRLPRWTPDEFEVLFVLMSLFVTVTGLRRHGAMASIASRLENGGSIPLKLVLGTFFLSMLITNDIALLVVVPLTLSLGGPHKDWLVILEALAANAGSAATPFGNPQNLFVYWHYHLDPATFIAAIAPFSVTFLILLAIAAWLVPSRHPRNKATPAIEPNHFALGYVALLLLTIAAVLRLLPLATAGAAMLFALLFDRRSLRIDYPLLLTFLCFFGVADMARDIVAAELSHGGHVFAFSALTSQLIGNVPAALLFADFTPDWKALLWGTNAGGFGSLVGSLANLIAYRLYLSNRRADETAAFTVKFLTAGYIALAISAAVFYLAIKH